MKFGRDLWVVAAIVLLLFCILQQALMGNAMAKLEARLTEIYETAQQQGGWIFIEEFKEDK
jgi:hypothetical protein